MLKECLFGTVTNRAVIGVLVERSARVQSVAEKLDAVEIDGGPVVAE